HAVALARGTEGAWDIHTFERRRLTAVREAPGLSGSTLTFLGAPGDPPLAVVRFTHRQRRAVENIRFVLEEALADRVVPADNPDLEYADAVARPIREAQAVVSGKQLAVIWRLLGYLARYRK